MIEVSVVFDREVFLVAGKNPGHLAVQLLPDRNDGSVPQNSEFALATFDSGLGTKILKFRYKVA